MSATPLFARPEFRAVAGEALRPGGLDLTRRGLTLAGLKPGGLVADLGCGPGATARLLAEAGHRVLAFDPEPGPAETHRGMLRACARAEDLPLPDACLDAACCECVLSVTGRAGEVLAEIGRVLKPGGALVLSDLCRRGPCAAASPAGETGGDCLSGAPPLDALLEDLRRAGLEVEAMEDHSRLLAELAGRLILSGLPLAELTRGCQGGGKPGYFLCVARKRARTHG